MNNDKNDLISSLSQKLGVDRDSVSEAVKNRSPESLIASMDPQDAQKLSKLLNDKEATKRLLQSEKVQKLIKKLSEGN